MKLLFWGLSHFTNAMLSRGAASGTALGAFFVCWFRMVGWWDFEFSGLFLEGWFHGTGTSPLWFVIVFLLVSVSSLCTPSNICFLQSGNFFDPRSVGRDAVVQSCGVSPQQVASSLRLQGWWSIRGYGGRLHSRLLTSCCILPIC
jgi:hypothetical protein